MTALVEIQTRQTEAQAAIVAQIEDLLEQAKAGRFESLLWFARRSSSTGVSWGHHGLNKIEVLGQLDILKHTLITDWMGDE